jgi:hypothetical protein
MTFLRVGHGILSFSTFAFLFDSELHSASDLFESLRVPQYRLAWDIDISKLPPIAKPVLTLRLCRVVRSRAGSDRYEP